MITELFFVHCFGCRNRQRFARIKYVNTVIKFLILDYCLGSVQKYIRKHLKILKGELSWVRITRMKKRQCLPKSQKSMRQKFIFTVFIVGINSCRCNKAISVGNSAYLSESNRFGLPADQVLRKNSRRRRKRRARLYKVVGGKIYSVGNSAYCNFSFGILHTEPRNLRHYAQKSMQLKVLIRLYLQWIIRI